MGIRSSLKKSVTFSKSGQEHFKKGGRMNLFTKTALLLLTLLTIQPVSGQFNVGVFGLTNSAGLNGDAPPNSKYTSNRRFGGGVVAEFKIAKDVMLSFQPVFLPKGATIAVDVPGERDPKDSLSVSLNYISLPLMVKVISGNGKTYVTGGLDVGFLQNATLKPAEGGGEEQDIKNLIQSLDVAANFGFGIMLPVGTPKLLFELRYTQGLMNISDVKPDPGEKRLPPQFKTTGFQFFAGLVIPFGKKN
jgi:hypothetical protein